MNWIGAVVLLAGCSDFEIEKVKDPPIEGTRSLVADPDLIDFGVLTSAGAVTETVSFLANGDLPVTVSTVDVAGSGAYSLTWASAETVVEPGESLEVIVTYIAASASDEARLVLTSDAVEPTLIVPLLGAGTYPALTVTPSSVGFLSQYGESSDEEVLVTSVGTADLELSDMIVQGAWFSAEGALPVTLAPGESTTISVTYTPEVQGENVTGKIWLTTNTAAGFAVVPLEAWYGVPCVGLGEAWDRGVLDPHTLFDGLTLDVSNLDTELEICVDRWYVYLSDDSQDLGAGDMDADFGDVYPHGSVSIEATASVEFEAGVYGDTSWWCMEDTQYTQRNADYTFIGAYVPEPLLSAMLAGDQDAVWEWENDNPVMIAARDTNYLQVTEAGGSGVVSLRALNMGSVDGSVEVRETVPAGWAATDWTVPPDRTEAGADGATVYVFDASLLAREKTGEYSPTDYDELWIDYTLTVPPCRGRQYVDSMTTRWHDSDGVLRTASANPLVVLCE